MVAYTSKFEPEAATGAGWRNTGYNYDDAWARRPSESRESDDWHSAYDYDLFSTAVRFQGENSTLIPLHLGTTYQDNRSGMLKYMYDAEGIGSFVHCDDNGNVIALTNGDGNGELSATYDYDPFGNFIRGTGTAAALNPYRFSAKYHDDVLDLYYYGFRFYSPSQGRFLNRDPIEEAGGLNLYAFVGNDPVSRIDYLGRYALSFVRRRTGSRTHRLASWRWDEDRERIVRFSQVNANIFSPRLHDWISTYMEEIADIYCPSEGRDILESEVSYAEATVSDAYQAMQSNQILEVSPGEYTGDDSRGVGAFVFDRDDRIWITDLFFEEFTSMEQAAVFFHEVTHLVGRTPGDDADEVGGWHRTGHLYEELFLERSYNGVIFRFETRNANFINGELLFSGNLDQRIRRRDGLPLGATRR